MLCWPVKLNSLSYQLYFDQMLQSNLINQTFQCQWHSHRWYLTPTFFRTQKLELLQLPSLQNLKENNQTKQNKNKNKLRIKTANRSPLYLANTTNITKPQTSKHTRIKKMICSNRSTRFHYILIAFQNKTYKWWILARMRLTGYVMTY